MNTRVRPKDQSPEPVRHGTITRTLSFTAPAVALGAAMLLLPLVGWAGGAVTNCTEAALRAAMAGGGTVTFACEGTITLGSTIVNAVNLTLDGSGHQVTISGGSAIRVFFVNTNVTLIMSNLTIANGRATNGAGLFNNGGTVSLQHCVFTANQAVGSSGFQTNGLDGYGGAICNAGSLSASRCSFAQNFAQGGGGSAGTSGIGSPGAAGGAGWAGGAGFGGAVANWGSLTVSESALLNNTAIGGGGGSGGSGGYGYSGIPGGNGSSGGSGSGGALYNSGRAALVNCTLAANSCAGGGGGGGGEGGLTMGWGVPAGPGGGGGGGSSGSGGALNNSGTVALVNCTLGSNNCAGGGGGPGGQGGRFHDDGVSHGVGGPGGGGSYGGSGIGSGLYNIGTAALVNCTLAANSCAGGNGGSGGHGGDAICFDYPTGGHGGYGGNGGPAVGVIYDSNGLVTLTNCTVASNVGTPATGGSGGGGGMASGGHPTWGANGAAGGNNTAFAGVQAAGSRVVNTLLATNSPGGNCSGRFTDVGHNLSSDGSCAFTNLGSLNNTDPKLGPLANNGGPTLTMALLPGSPAIDAADTTAAPSTDQRGFPRPAGAAADIGAFELGARPPSLAITRPGGTAVGIVACADPGQSCRLLTSSNLSSWVPMATNQIGTNGTVSFQDSFGPGITRRLYRLAMP